MSNVSDIFDAMVIRVAALLPNHTRIPDAYTIEDNPITLLRQGWALAYGPAVNGDRFLSAKLTYQRILLLTITRECISLEGDVESKVDVEQSLMEDIVTVSNDFTSDSTLNNATNRVKYLGDTGVQRIWADKHNFLMTQIEIQSEVTETL